MRPKNMRKLISLTHYDPIDTWLKDIGLLEGKTESLVAEEVLLGLRPGMLPPSPSARGNILAWYADDDAVSQLYRSAFGYLSQFAKSTSETPLHSAYLVNNLLSELLHTNDRITLCDERSLPYYITAVRDLCEALALEHAKLTGSSAAANELALEIQHAKEIYRQLTKTPQYIQCRHIITIVHSTWNYCCTYPSTYRLLCSQMDILPLPNTATSRLGVLSAIHKVSATWPN